MSNQTFFAPQLYIERGTFDISFYIKALKAIELRRFANEDGSIHVSELSIEGAMFHLHEETLRKGEFSPSRYSGSTVTIGLFVTDVDEVVSRAVQHGAVLISPAQDYDYGYRQAEIKDPFGHVWMIEKKIY